MAVYDIGFGKKTCDHLVKEWVQIVDGVVELTFIFDNLRGKFELYKNGVLVPGAGYVWDASHPKRLTITGVVIDPLLYPKDDYELLYATPELYCKKCIKEG